MNHLRLFGLLLLVLILSLAAKHQKGSPSDGGSDSKTVSLAVMTFNIRYANPGDGVHQWDNRKDWVAEIIRSTRPDVAGLQEALRHQIDTLMIRLPEYGWIGQGRDDGMDGGEFSPIVYRKDRIAILSTGTFWLSATPDEAGSTGWDAALPRIVTWAVFRERASGTLFYHFNTHFDHMGEIARLESARLLRRRIADIAGAAPFVVTGDFNAVEESDPIQELVQIRARDVTLKDSRAAAGDADLTTFRGFEIGSATNRRIDYVFFSDHFRIERHVVLDESRNGSYPSDHLPVLASGSIN